MILIISGSTRANSQSLKVSKVLMGKLQKLGADAEVLDLNQSRLPLYDDSGQQSEWPPISEKIQKAEGYVWVVPEWNGTAGPGIMNLLAYLKSQTDHKPVLLAAVSSGSGGVYPLAQLKAFGAKNSKVVFVPEQLRFREVKSMFNSTQPESDNNSDQTLHERSQYALEVLLAYSDSLKQLRNSGKIDVSRYPNGF